MFGHQPSNPKHPTEPEWAEANTQAEFYHHARLLGLPVSLEMYTPAGRVDIAVLSKDRTGLIVIVECKRDGRTLYPESWQIRRYKKLGVPVYGLNQWGRAERLVRTIIRHHGDSPGLPWNQLKEVVPLPRRIGHLDRMAYIADLDGVAV